MSSTTSARTNSTTSAGCLPRSGLGSRMWNCAAHRSARQPTRMAIRAAGRAGLAGFACLMLTLLIFGVIVPAGDLLTLPRAVELSPPRSDQAAQGTQDAPAGFLALLAFGALPPSLAPAPSRPARGGRA